MTRTANNKEKKYRFQKKIDIDDNSRTKKKAQSL